jgi:hypothetical protein
VVETSRSVWRTLLALGALGCLGSAAAAPARPPRLVFHYEAPTNAALAPLAAVLKEEQTFTGSGSMASQFKLQQNIDVFFRQCGVENAFYDTETRSITLCYELFSQLGAAFSSEEATAEEVGSAVLGASYFIFLHEFGHALVHNLDLPVTGKEEDAVDDLATLILINAGEQGEASVVAGLLHFAALSEARETGDASRLAFWDEHSLHGQRLYSVACLLYGSDPDAFAALVGPKGLPAERAGRCPAEFAQKSRAWDQLLAPHVR